MPSAHVHTKVPMQVLAVLFHHDRLGVGGWHGDRGTLRGTPGLYATLEGIKPGISNTVTEATHVSAWLAG